MCTWKKKKQQHFYETIKSSVERSQKPSAQEPRALHSREIRPDPEQKTYCFLEHAVLYFPAVKLFWCYAVTRSTFDSNKSGTAYGLMLWPEARYLFHLAYVISLQCVFHIIFHLGRNDWQQSSEPPPSSDTKCNHLRRFFNLQSPCCESFCLQVLLLTVISVKISGIICFCAQSCSLLPPSLQQRLTGDAEQDQSLH